MAAGRWREWRRIGRLSQLGRALAMAVVAIFVIPPWISVFLTSARLRSLAISLLVGLKITYGVVLVGSVIGAMVLGGVFWRARLRGVRRPMVARGLLLCCACLIGLAVAEAIAATWAAPARSMPAVPARPRVARPVCRERR